MNKYTKWYNNIIAKCVERNWNKKTSGCYVEKHHIIPKSLGGGNKNNLVYLTAKEHFISHLLLSKMYDGKSKSKMQLALYMFTKNPSLNSNRKMNSYSYEYAKKCLASATKTIHTGLAKPKSDEHRLKLSLALKGKPNPASSKWMTGRIMPQETRNKISIAGKGRKFSMEAKQKIKQAALAQWARYHANGNQHTPEQADNV
jgi:hypothetical protein